MCRSCPMSHSAERACWATPSSAEAVGRTPSLRRADLNRGRPCEACLMTVSTGSCYGYAPSTSLFAQSGLLKSWRLFCFQCHSWLAYLSQLVLWPPTSLAGSRPHLSSSSSVSDRSQEEGTDARTALMGDKPRTIEVATSELYHHDSRTRVARFRPSWDVSSDLPSKFFESSREQHQKC